MARANIVNGSNVGEQLGAILTAGDIQTASGIDYALCKAIYQFHVLGKKIADKPIEIAQSQKRDLSVAGAGQASEEVKEKFELTHKSVGAEGSIANLVSLSRVYGAAAIGLLENNVDPRTPLQLRDIWKKDLSFNVYDPLNVAGSLVLDQNPMSKAFMHVTEVSVNGQPFHRSRTCVQMNEQPLYIAYTPSAFGYTGRSVYQRPLLPMKSFIQTMVTDDMVTRKAGVLVAKIKQAGSIITQPMRWALGFKRNVVQEAEVGNTISIGTDGEEIESIDLKNLSEPFNSARKNVIENIASGADMPALLLNEESLGGSFHEGSEDARVIARFIDRFREKMDPVYDWFDEITMRLAWTPEWYAQHVQRGYPDEWEGVPFDVFFWRCHNSFRKKWPSLLKEPESEQVEVEKVKLEAIIKWVEVLLPNVPKEDRAATIQWANDQFNSLPLLFGGGDLLLDYERIAAFESTPTEPKGGNLGFGHDSVPGFADALIKHLEEMEKKRRLSGSKPRLVRLSP